MDEGASVSCINMGRSGHACAGIAEADARIRALAAENERLKAGANDTMQAQHGALLELQRENDQLRARIRALGGRQVLVTLTADRAAAVDRLPGSSDAARIEGLLDALAGWEADAKTSPENF